MLFLLATLSSMMSFSATYYVSTAGNDSNAGTTADAPWKTLEKINSTSFLPGDNILFKKGDTFYGSVTVSSSGTSGNPITFGAYGTGPNPVITGFTNVPAWTDLGNNIWESTNSVSGQSTCNMVVINGINTESGRYPNSNAEGQGYLYFKSHTTTSITSSSLTGTPDWTGARIVMKPNRFRFAEAIITSQSGGTLNYTSLSETPTDGYGFVIKNDIRTLDRQNEWYYNPTTKKLDVYSVGQPTNVKVTSRNTLVLIKGNYVIVENLDLVGANSYGIWAYKSSHDGILPHHVIIQDCNTSFTGWYGIAYRGNYITIQNCNIDESNWSGITGGKSGISSILNNTVTNTARFPTTNVGAGILAGYGCKSIDAEGNRIINSGESGMNFSTDSTLFVKNNFVDTYCTISDDAGGIYCGGSSNTYGLRITENIFINGIGNGYGTPIPTSKADHGIYLDENTQHFEVDHNSVISCGSGGIFLHCSANNNIHDNTVYDTYAQIQFSAKSTSLAITNNIISNNKFISKTATQYCLSAGTYGSGDPITSFGTFTNNYYARPIDDNLTIKTQTSSSSTTVLERTLAQWQTYSSQDANSHQSPKTITDTLNLQFYYNDTKEIKAINIDQPMMDVTGVKYYGNLSLQPFTSVVLIKDVQLPVASTEYISICDGSNYKGWTTTGKYEQKLVTPSGVYSDVTTYLSVNPKYAVIEDIAIEKGQSYQGWTESGTYIRTLNSLTGCDSTVTTKLTVALNSIKTGETETTQTIELKAGYNLVSTYITPQDPAIPSVFQSLVNAGTLLKIRDEVGNSFENMGDLAGWVNNLGSIQPTEGYKISVANDCAMQVTGLPITLPLDIPLITGWNIISFPRADASDGMAVIQSLIDQNKLVKVQDEEGHSIENWGLFGGWKNNIGNFVPGKAYKVKTNGNATLTYQPNASKSANITAQRENTEYFIPSYEGNGTDHLNINLVGLSGSGLTMDDELAAFDGDRCVGALKISEDHILSGTASLISSYSTNELHPDGFQEGHPIQIRRWNQTTRKESTVQAEVVSGQLIYEKNASVWVQVKSISTGMENIPKDLKMDVFPNPSDGRFTVRFSQIPDAGSWIDVLDVSGRKIASRLIAESSELFSLEGQAAGTYLVKSVMGSSPMTERIIIR